MATATLEGTRKQQELRQLSPEIQTSLAQLEQEESTDATHPDKSLDEQPPMMTISLLHPQSSVPFQTWHLEANSSVRIGRSRNNQVTLYSTVVSRCHLEIRPKGNGWELVSFGSNGTFYQGQRIKRMPLKNGMVIQLAASGPQLQIGTEVLTKQTDQTKQPTVQLAN